VTQPTVKILVLLHIQLEHIASYNILRIFCEI